MFVANKSLYILIIVPMDRPLNIPLSQPQRQVKYIKRKKIKSGTQSLIQES